MEWVAIGDALGLPYEFRRKSNILVVDKSTGVVREWETRRGGRFNSHLELLDGSTYSDDTQMMLMVARSIVNSMDTGYESCSSLFIEELKAFLGYQQGAGRATRNACNCWTKNKTPFTEDFYSAGGNGVLMRVQPFALLDLDYSSIMKLVLENGITTHGDPVALIPAMLYVLYLKYRLDNVGSTNEDVYKFLIDNSKLWSDYDYFPEISLGFDFQLGAVSEYKARWEEVAEDMLEFLKDDNIKQLRGIELAQRVGACGRYKGSGVNTLKFAMIESLHFTKDTVLQDMLSATKVEDTDTDTIGAVLGGLVATEFDIPSAVKDWVDDYSYINSLENCVREGIPFGEKILPEGVAAKNIREYIKDANVGETFRCEVFGVIKVCNIFDMPIGETKYARAKICLSRDGQTLTYKYYKSKQY